MTERGSELGWDGTRPLRVVEKLQETADVASIWLAPADPDPLPAPLPGQYLTLEVPVAGAPAPLVRCYSLSAVEEDRYRLTIKAIGRASRALVEETAPGQVLSARAPLGRFVLTAEEQQPAVLLGAGIGITPFVAMLRARACEITGGPLQAVLGFRSGAEHPLRAEIQQLAGLAGAELSVLYSQPGETDVLGRDYDRQGRVTVELLRELLPPTDSAYRFYLCGPAAFMSALSEGLTGLGIPAGRILTESFSASSARDLTRRSPRDEPSGVVRFARSDRQAAWDPQLDALLYLAEREGVPIPYACGTGRCGTCATGLISGEVRYPFEPEFPRAPGRCLPCLARPWGDVTLDA